MDGAITREQAEARWRRDLDGAVARSEQDWPREVTSRMSEFEWLTLVTESLMPVRNELRLEFQETDQRDEPARQAPGGGHDNDGGTGEEREGEENEALGVSGTYPVVAATAAVCARWLREDLGPGLRAGGQGIRTPMTLDHARDIDHWARERARPMMEEPAEGDDIEGWLHWADLRMARTLPEEDAPPEEWSGAAGHGLAGVREAVHRLTLARLHVRAGDRGVMEANAAAQATENVYRTVVWLASTLQAWGAALVRVQAAAHEADGGA